MDLDALREESVHTFRQRMRLTRPGHAWEALSDADFLLRLGAAGTGADLQNDAAVVVLVLRDQEQPELPAQSVPLRIERFQLFRRLLAHFGILTQFFSFRDMPGQRLKTLPGFHSRFQPGLLAQHVPVTGHVQNDLRLLRGDAQLLIAAGQLFKMSA